MPLIHSRSKKAFSENVRREMHAGKPQKQALAISYSVQRKAKKKAAGGSVESGSRDMNMAEGGSISASNERRPMPDNAYDDSHEIMENRGRKALKDADWTGRPTVRQAQAHDSKHPLPIKRPKIVEGATFKSRPHDELQDELHDQEADLQASAAPASPEEQPKKSYDEEGADRQGPRVRDMEDEHSTHRKPYAKGGEVEAHDYEHPSNPYEHDYTHDTPSHDEGAMMAREHNEEGPDRQGPDLHDHEKPHSDDSLQMRMEHADHVDGREPQAFSEGGEAHDIDDSLSHEEEEEHHNSIAAAVMARMHARDEDGWSGSEDMDEAERYAEGGEILKHSDEADIKSHDSIYADDSDRADLSRNADEDANEEDQLSWNALRKENYSESEGLKKLDSPDDSSMHSDDPEMNSHDSHDMISSIRRKMKSRKQF